MTFSIVARDPRTGDLGVAVESKFLAVGAMVPFARAGVGAVATQAMANLTFGPRGLEGLAAGGSASSVLDALVASDDGREHRQAAIVDAQGRVAAYTGSSCFDWAGHRTGDGWSCQGNILASEAVVGAMAAAMERGSGLPLVDRLVEALLAGQAEGGDRRGQQGAAVLVVREGAGYGGGNDRLFDLRVDDHREPILELKRLVALHRLYFERPEEAELLRIDGTLAGEIARRLTAIEAEWATRGAALSRGGATPPAAPAPIDPTDAAALWSRLEAWAGNENLEERFIKPGFIDPVSLAVLRGEGPTS